MIRVAALLVATSVAGCATGPTRSEVLASLVGRPEADAIRTLGAPNRILQANNSRFLAYDERSLNYAPGPGFGPYGPFGYGYFIPVTVPYERSCETTVEVTGGVVRSWNLRGNGC